MPTKKKTPKSSGARRPVIVCTERRLVVFGYTTSKKEAPTTIRITDARVATRFGTTKGIGELAATGPTSKSLIGARIPGLALRLVTAVMDVSADATKAWEAAP